MKNYYKTLGISQYSSKEEIKKAYRILAVKYHPDKNPDQRFSEQFKEINEAKQVLLDDFKKFQYDIMLIHFLYGNKAKRSRFQFHNAYFPVKYNKVFFIGLLFLFTILVTVAFYQTPLYEATSDAPVIVNTVSQVEKEVPREKEQPIAKTFIPPSRLIEKTFRKPPVNPPIKKAKQVVFVPKKPKKKTGFTALTSPALIHEKAIQKQLSNEKMVQILNDIKAEKERLGSKSNCVQIIKTETSNVQNAFMLATFLRSYGYIISGREKISDNSNGIIIDAKNNCITVTIGTL